MQEPRVDLPYMPGYEEMIAASGGKTLPWSWALGRIAANRNFWLTTVHAEGRPQSTPVWGVWMDGDVAAGFAFSCSERSRKARNFRANPFVTVSTESGAEAVIIEGTVAVMPDDAQAAFVGAYQRKYDWKLTPDMAPFYVVEPRVAFGMREYGDTEIGGVTRWSFG